jgi:hypothetical protein
VRKAAPVRKAGKASGVNQAGSDKSKWYGTYQ